MSETYSDNITLAPRGQESEDFVTEVTPGVAVRGVGRRLRLDLDYEIQNLAYANASERNDSFHRLQTNANAELIENTFFLDANAAISQVNVASQDRLATDNLSVTGNRSDVTTFTISPYVRQSFKRLVDMELRYNYSEIDVDIGASDGTTDEFLARFNSGPRFSRLTWNLNYRDQNVDRDAATDADFERADGRIQYRMNRRFSVLGLMNYENNSFTTSRNIRDGTSYAVGIAYHPSRRLLLEVATGSRLDVTRLNWRPTERTNIDLTFSDSEIGANSGSRFQAAVSHSTRRATFGLTVSEDVSTIQQRLLESFAVLVDETGNPVIDPLTGFPVTGEVGLVDSFIDPVTGQLFSYQDRDLLTLTDDVFVSKRANAFVTYQTGKSNFRVSVFTEERTFELDNQEDKAVGSNAAWTWQFAPRTRSILSASWRRDDARGAMREDDTWTVRLGLARRLSRKVTGVVDILHTERDSDLATSEYEENRIAARLTKQF